MNRLVAISFCVSLLAVILPSLAADNIQTLQLGKQQQESVALTIYNNFALVQDVRSMVLPEGELLVEFTDVASTIKSSSVQVRPANGSALQVLEQAYHFDLLNRQSLLETYIGRKLKYSRTVLQGATYEKVLREGILLSTNPEIVDFGDEIEISPEGTISLPTVPQGLTLKPTLEWRISNARSGRQTLRTAYIANDISWQADYTLLLNETTSELLLESWATINNNSGTDFENAAIQLVAGQVNQVQEAPSAYRARAQMEMMAADVSVAPEALHSYQLFRLPRSTDLIHHEEKQIKFLEARGVRYDTVYRLQSRVAAHAYPTPLEPAVSSEITFKNAENNALGTALPAGIGRVYLDTRNGPQLLGETRFAATPDGQTVTLQLGQSFDITATREQTSFRRLGDRSYEAAFKITLANSKRDAVKVVVDELMQGDWELLEAAHASEKLNQQNLRFTLLVPGKGEEILEYRVRFRT